MRRKFKTKNSQGLNLIEGVTNSKNNYTFDLKMDAVKSFGLDNKTRFEIYFRIVEISVEISRSVKYLEALLNDFANTGETSI